MIEQHQERVIKEHNELDEKIEKLHVFIEDSDVFKNLSTIDQRLLINQRCMMIIYRDILRQRISLF